MASKGRNSPCAAPVGSAVQPKENSSFLFLLFKVRFMQPPSYFEYGRRNNDLRYTLCKSGENHFFFSMERERKGKLIHQVL